MAVPVVACLVFEFGSHRLGKSSVFLFLSFGVGSVCVLQVTFWGGKLSL